MLPPVEEISDTAMARALVVGLASLLRGDPPSMKTAKQEDLLKDILTLVKKALASPHLQEELRLLKRRGPDRYIKYAVSDIRKGK